MKTTKDDAERILDQVRLVVDARIRPMMGEYILYVNERVTGQINQGELFIKVTPFGEGFAPELTRKPPYPGAKPAFVLPQDKIDDTGWLHEFISGTVEQLPAPKNKR